MDWFRFDPGPGARLGLWKTRRVPKATCGEDSPHMAQDESWLTKLSEDDPGTE